MQAVYGDQCVDVSTVRLGKAVQRWRIGASRFQKQNTNFFKDGFQNLVQHWWQCTEVRGDFAEK